MKSRLPLLFLSALAPFALGARGCLWDSWSPAQQTPSSPPKLISCLPALCSFYCTAALTPEGLPAHPLVNPDCPTDEIQPNVITEIRTWITDTFAQECADPPMGATIMNIPVPAAIVCPQTTCAPNPNLLAPSCFAVCQTDAAPPALKASCPDPNDNTAMEEFSLALEGVICNDQATTNPYAIYPDPSLIDKTVCMHRGRP